MPGQVRRDRFIALLRAVNVTGHNKLPMAELRAACAKSGMGDVATYIQSGNIILSAGGSPDDVEAQLEKLIARKFGLSVAAIVRRASAWPAYIESNPFRESSTTDPNLVMLALSKKPPSKDALELLRSRAANGELIELVGDAIWIHYKKGVGVSRLSSFLDRAVGSPVTSRNWRTVLKLRDMTEKD